MSPPEPEAQLTTQAELAAQAKLGTLADTLSPPERAPGAPAPLRVRRVGAVVVPLPEYASAGAAGLDLRAALHEEVTLAPGARRLLPTGIAVALPEGFEAQVRSRSGLALRHGVAVLNAPGTIDSDYRGEIGVVLINHGREPFVVQPLARIAQLVIAPVARVDLVLVEHLDATERGAGGYGSTGVG